MPVSRPQISSAEPGEASFDGQSEAGREDSLRKGFFFGLKMVLRWFFCLKGLESLEYFAEFPEGSKKKEEREKKQEVFHILDYFAVCRKRKETFSQAN